MNPTGKAAHEAHELPLASRLVTDAIQEFINTGCAIASAGAGTWTAEEKAKQQAIKEMRYLHLSGVDYRLTPLILDTLRRAGLLRDPERTP